jgi:hypothetical protein
MFNRHPLASAFLIFLILVVVGTVLGGAYGILVAESIGRKLAEEDPLNPRDMLHMVVITHGVLGFLAGTGLGLLVAAIVYISKRQELSDQRSLAQGIKS